jgi:hypothetical protein
MGNYTDETLAAPTVDEADGGYLRPDMMPLGPTVRIPLHADSAPGDELTLSWTGGPSNDSHWTSRRTLVAAGEACVFRVPFLVLVAANAYDITAHYVLRRAGSDVDEMSYSATFTVQDHPAFSLLQVYDHDGIPTDVVAHHAPWFEARLPEDIAMSLVEGDEVVISVRGVVSQLGSSMIEAASTLWSLPVTAGNVGLPVRARFAHELIAANYGEGMLLRAAIVRTSGYIQYPFADYEVRVTRATELLTPVRTDELSGDEVILDQLEPGQGLAVSVINQAQTEGAVIRFHLADSRTEAYPAGDGPAVDGTISREILERHGDSDCYLYCQAIKEGDDGFETVVGSSPRRRITIRRKTVTDPLPRPDPLLAIPAIDGVPSGQLDPARFPCGPFARIPASADIMEGDLVTFVLRIPEGVVEWTESILIDANLEGLDLVRRIPPWFLDYAQDKRGWLYYSIERNIEAPRHSPSREIAIGGYVPRNFYPYACSMKRREDNVDLIECPVDQPPWLGVQNAVLRFAPGDLLIVTLLGNASAASATIEVAVDGELDTWFFVDIPADLIRRNAGHVLRYRTTKIRLGHIDHSPYKALGILPTEGGHAGTRSWSSGMGRRLLGLFRRDMPGETSR